MNILSIFSHKYKKKRIDIDMDTNDYKLFLEVFNYLHKYKKCFTKMITRLTIGDEDQSYIFKLELDVEEYQNMYDTLIKLIGDHKNYIVVSELTKYHTFTIFIDMSITNNAIYDLYKRNF